MGDGDELEIRVGRPDDAEELVDVHLRAWRWAYTGLIDARYIDYLWSQRADRIERRRAGLAAPDPGRATWVAVRDGRVVGFISWGPTFDEDAREPRGEVYAVYLAPEAARQGIGRRLMEHATADLRERGFRQGTLWCLATNERGRAFYSALGWQLDGAEKVEERPPFDGLHEVRFRIDLAPD